MPFHICACQGYPWVKFLSIPQCRATAEQSRMRAPTLVQRAGAKARARDRKYLRGGLATQQLESVPSEAADIVGKWAELVGN